MSGFINLTVTGAEENAQKLGQLSDQVPGEVKVGITAGLQPIRMAMRSYPGPVGYVGHKAGGVNTYSRTGNYRDRISDIDVSQQGDSFVGEITSGADYSVYLRGDLNGYPGAWMHLGAWESLQSIVDRLLPQARDIIEQQLSALIKRLGLGD